MSAFTVVYDACVLYPADMRDFLMRLATAGLFRAKWTDRIHEEWIGNLLAKRSDLSRSRLERTRDKMNGAVEDCLVTGYERFEKTICLPDENDRHVVAAAIKARADAIVTLNLKDFPEDTLRELGLEPIHPDVFALNQFDLNRGRVIETCRHHRSELRNPRKTPSEYLGILVRAGFPLTVNALMPFANRL